MTSATDIPDPIIKGGPAVCSRDAELYIAEQEVRIGLDHACALIEYAKAELRVLTQLHRALPEDWTARRVYQPFHDDDPTEPTPTRKVQFQIIGYGRGRTVEFPFWMTDAEVYANIMQFIKDTEARRSKSVRTFEGAVLAVEFHGRSRVEVRCATGVGTDREVVRARLPLDKAQPAVGRRFRFTCHAESDGSALEIIKFAEASKP